MTKRKKGGRPTYRATDEDREKVSVLTASGMKQREIAVVIGVSIPTLRKHFFVELNEGAIKKRAEVMDARYRAAIGGNISAQNRFLATSEAVPPQKSKEPKLGKKELAKKEADTAHTDSEWGDLLH